MRQAFPFAIRSFALVFALACRDSTAPGGSKAQQPHSEISSSSFDLQARSVHPAATVYSNTFNSAPGPEWSGNVGVGTTGPVCALGVPLCGGFLATNGGTPFSGSGATLSLNGLPAHNVISVRLRLLVLQSYDGNYSFPGVGPDSFQVKLDGTTLLNTTFSNTGISPNQTQCYSRTRPNCPGTNPSFSGSLIHAMNGADVFGSTGLYEDSGYAIDLTATHTRSSVVLEFVGTGGMQGWPDEGWAIADVAVRTR